jgi:cytochrome c oxidase subunit 2
MEGIVDFHNYIMFYLVVIFLFVITILGLLVFEFVYFAQLPSEIKKRKRFLLLQKFNSWTLLEFFWTLFPVFILLFIAYPSYNLLFVLDESFEPIATLKVVGHQWYWSYDWTWGNTTYLEFDSNYQAYDEPSFQNDKDLMGWNKSIKDQLINKPTLLGTDAPLFFPVNQKIRILVTAEDVLHSWALPKLGIKLDCVPGRLNQVFIKVNRLGRFYGQCSELCGVGHGQMPIEVFSV